jgi:hypothetical protein
LAVKATLRQRAYDAAVTLEIHTVRRGVIARYPRLTGAVAFGVAATLTTHFAWVPDARWSGITPMLTGAAGATHAITGVIVSTRLLDPRRTRTVIQAGLVGSAASLIALMLFAPTFGIYVLATSGRSSNIASWLAMPFFVAVFAFLAIGWALMLVSSVIGCALYLTAPRTG